MISLSLLVTSGLEAKDSLGKQFFKNIHFGCDINQNDDYRWRNVKFGTAFGGEFGSDEQASLKIGVEYNWSKYSIYSNNYALVIPNDILRTQSLSFPLVAEYKVYKSFFNGISLSGGPVYELILNSQLNGNNFTHLNKNQFGWTAGARIRFLAILSVRIGYVYYPTKLFDDNSLNRSALTLSIGF